MKKEEIIRKLTSRKLWLALALFVSGLITAFTGEGGVAETVAGCIMQGAAVIGYFVGEGLVDAKRANSSTSKTEEDAELEGLIGELIEESGEKASEDAEA